MACFKEGLAHNCWRVGRLFCRVRRAASDSNFAEPLVVEQSMTSSHVKQEGSLGATSKSIVRLILAISLVDSMVADRWVTVVNILEDQQASDKFDFQDNLYLSSGWGFARSKKHAPCYSFLCRMKKHDPQPSVTTMCTMSSN